MISLFAFCNNRKLEDGNQRLFGWQKEASPKVMRKRRGEDRKELFVLRMEVTWHPSNAVSTCRPGTT